MRRVLPPANATFNAAAGTITFSNTIPLSLSHILRVTNLDRAVVYVDPTNNTNSGILSSASYESPVLTIKLDTSNHGNSDKLFIEYDDGIGLSQSEITGTVPGSSEVEVKNDSGNPIPASVAAVGATNDAAATTDGGTFSIVALLKRLLGKLPALSNGNIPVSPAVQLGGGANTATTQRVTLAEDDPLVANLASIAGLSIPAHDYIALSYTGINLTGVVYKTGGSGGTTVGTLTLAYSGSTLTSVTRS